MRSTSIFISFLSIIFVTFFSCKNQNENTQHLGELHHQFKVNEEAKPHFETGLLLLHNFEYEDARSAFLKAQKIDPEAIMPIWGEAMTFNHPLWRRQEFDEGAQALLKLGEDENQRKEKAISEIESDFLKGVEILFGPGEKDERDQAYSQHMKKMYEQFPEHEEVAAFYALSILGAVPVGRNVEAYESGADVVKSVLARNPQHPGALHYLIHSYDDPAHAHMALDAAANYSKVASDAVHALHMPSHIFLAVGMWDEVVSSNIASFAASQKRMEEKELDYDALSYHALNWQQYGHLQLDQMDEAKLIMDDMLHYTDSMPSRQARAYCIAMKGAYLLETEDWQHPISDFDVSLEDLGLTARAKVHFINGTKALLEEDQEKLASHIKELQEDINRSSLLIDETGLPMCSSGSGSSIKVNRLDIDQAQVMCHQLSALQAGLMNDTAKQEGWLIKATDLENQLGYGYGPPVILQPSFEMYGQFLINQGRYKEAEVQFEKSLDRAPNRRLSLKGLKVAKENQEQAI